MFGRRQIFTTTENITAENVVSELNEALALHVMNMREMEYLYWYRRGKQPILNRQKVVRQEINNKIVENHAAEIVAFKNGYFLTQPAFYVSRKEDKSVTERVNRLNEYLYLSGKQKVDNEVVDWFHTVGLGIVYVEPYPDKAVPVRAYALDPRSAFVVYSRRHGKMPVMGVNIVITGKKDNVSQAVFDVYTRDSVFRVSGGITGSFVADTPIVTSAIEVISQEENKIGEIPIIEYQYDRMRMGAFETVISTLDAINTTQSNRIDGIEQFIQSLMVFYNCALGEDKDGNPITPAYIRAAGAIFLKSIGQDRADLKILSEQLDQTQTQVVVDYMYQQVLAICGMPSTTKGGTSTSDTGVAVLYRDGWEQADTVARNTWDLFRESNERFDAVFTKILNKKTDLNINPADFELKLVRNETANLLSKTQAAMNLKELGISPELTFAKSGLSNDPVADVANSKKYIDVKWGVFDETENAEASVDTSMMEQQ